MIPRIFVAVLLAQVYGRYPTRPVLTQDPASGVYSLSYTGSDGARRTVQFISGDRIAPQLNVQSISGHGPFHYVYRLANGSEGKLPIAGLAIPCEPASTVQAPRVSARVVNYDPSILPRPRSFYCDYNLMYRNVSPGSVFSDPLTLDSSWLPGIRSVFADGLTEVLTLPGWNRAIGEEADDEVSELYRSSQQKEFSFQAVSPTYSPDQFANPAAALSLVLGDLDQVCKLGWIDNQGVCNSLSTKLQNAQKSLGTPAAKNVLQAFLNELSAQSGKHVNPNAYALLSTNVSYLADRL